MTQIELIIDNNEEYQVKSIYNIAIYAKKLKSGYLPRFYYLVFWKCYFKEENIWEPTSIV